MRTQSKRAHPLRVALMGVPVNRLGTRAQLIGQLRRMRPEQRILLVGANGELLARIRKMLSRRLSDISITEATDGISAVHRFLRLEPALVIALHNTPLMNGAMLLREIRSFDPETPIVLIGSDPRVVNLVGPNSVLRESHLAELPMIVQGLIQPELTAA